MANFCRCLDLLRQSLLVNGFVLELTSIFKVLKYSMVVLKFSNGFFKIYLVHIQFGFGFEVFPLSKKRNDGGRSTFELHLDVISRMGGADAVERRTTKDIWVVIAGNASKHCAA